MFTYEGLTFEETWRDGTFVFIDDDTHPLEFVYRTLLDFLASDKIEHRFNTVYVGRHVFGYYWYSGSRTLKGLFHIKIAPAGTNFRNNEGYKSRLTTSKAIYTAILKQRG
jgi:hypothetical protein